MTTMKEPRMSENGEIGTIQITCYDGTVIQIPDDNRVTEHLGGRTIEEIYTDSRRLPAECEKFVVYRPQAARLPYERQNVCTDCGQNDDAEAYLIRHEDLLNSIANVLDNSLLRKKEKLKEIKHAMLAFQPTGVGVKADAAA